MIQARTQTTIDGWGRVIVDVDLPRITRILRELLLVPFYPLAAIRIARRINAGEWPGENE